ncbi:hypothetical protein CPL00146S_CDS0111 [Escherichia phage SmurfNell]
MEKGGVEPSSSACKADVLPLNYIPKIFKFTKAISSACVLPSDISQ